MRCRECGADMGNEMVCPRCQHVHQETGDVTGGVIPYKNVPALIAYYTGIFSIIPPCGIVLGPPAFILGIVGLSQRKKNPIIKGAVHAWIGIVLGFLSFFVYLFLVVLMFLMNRAYW